MEELKSDPQVRPEDLALVAEITASLIALKREIGFYAWNGGIAPGTALVANPERSPELPGLSTQGLQNLDNDVEEYLKCLDQKPKLKDAVVAALADRLGSHYSPRISDNPAARLTVLDNDGRTLNVSFFTRFVPGKPIDLKSTDLNGHDVEALSRATRRAERLGDFTPTRAELNRLVWAEWLLERHGTADYKATMHGTGRTPKGEPFSFERPDWTKPSIASIVQGALFSEVDRQRR